MDAINHKAKTFHKKRDITIYLITELCLFVLIKTAEIKNFPYFITGKFMYSAIIINFLAVWYFTYHSPKGTDSGKSLIPVALTFTLAADFFLVLIDRFWLVGVLLFCIVQTIYAIQLERDAAYLFEETWRLHLTASLCLRVVLFLIFLYVLYRVSYLDILTAFAVLSMAMLTINVLFGWIEFSQTKKASSLLFALGLLLFAGCDLSLGLRNFSIDMSGLDTLYRISAFCIWVFYVPSQVLIVMSEYMRHH